MLMETLIKRNCLEIHPLHCHEAILLDVSPPLCTLFLSHLFCPQPLLHH